MATGDKIATANPVNASVQDMSQSFAEHFSDTMHNIWNDVNCLGAILVISTLLGCFLIHHVDLRQRLLGARMRIACCSLIYRKVRIFTM